MTLSFRQTENGWGLEATARTEDGRHTLVTLDAGNQIAEGQYPGYPIGREET